MTMDLYTHVTKEMKRKEAAKIAFIGMDSIVVKGRDKKYLPRNPSKINNSYLHDPLVTEKCVLFKSKSHCYNQTIKRKHPFE